MLDSVKLSSPALTEELADLVERQLVRRSALDMATGEVLYELTAGPLTGSWDHRVSCRIERHRFRRMPQGDRFVVARVSSAPYLVVEGSIHKAMLGHNVYGGPESFSEAVAWFVHELNRRVGAVLPPAAGWEVMRVDWSEVYELGYEGCRQYVRALNSSVFPRRSVIRYGDESLMAPGRTTALKVYHKGPEFLQHDAKRLRQVLTADELKRLACLAGDRLRVEVAIKKPKIRDRYGSGAKVSDVALDWIKGVHRTEIGRLIREAKKDMKVVRDSHAVHQRLYERHGDRLATALWATWLQLSGLGESWVKEQMHRQTYWRHRRYLTEAGISWKGTDVVVGEEDSLAYPPTFVPVPADVAHRGGEAPEVVDALARFRRAS